MRPGDRIVIIQSCMNELIGAQGIYTKTGEPELVYAVWDDTQEEEAVGVDQVCLSSLGHIGIPCVFCNYKEASNVETG